MDAVDVVAVGEPASPFEAGARLSPAAQTLRAAIAQGLVALDGKGQVVPGLADRWIVTDDGMSYIFRLRDGARIGNARLTAATARAALLQNLASLRGTALGTDLASIEEIRVMTGRVIEIRLGRPQPDLLLLLAQPELGLMNRGKGAGPMELRRDGQIAYLTPLDPQRRGLPAVENWKEAIRTVRLRALPAGSAVDRFVAGKADIVIGGRLEHFPLLAERGVSRAAIRLDPVAGLLGLVFLHRDGFLADRLNREAIAMAIDRDALPGAVAAGGWITTDRILPAVVEDGPEAAPEGWAGMTMDDRRATAMAQIGRWRSAGRELPGLRIALPAGPGADRLFARLEEDLGKVGLRAVRVGLAAPADLRLLDVVARYPRSFWYFNQLSCDVLPGPCSEEADDLVARARSASDPAERMGLVIEAEKTLADSAVYVPLGVPLRWSLVRGDEAGFAVNRYGIHPLMPMAARPK